jgi:hypothetical protein
MLYGYGGLNYKEEIMSYYFNKILTLSFEDAILRVTDELKKEGFGILTDIDVQAALKKKMDVDFRKYRILGSCNPPFAKNMLGANLHSSFIACIFRFSILLLTLLSVSILHYLSDTSNPSYIEIN